MEAGIPISLFSVQENQMHGMNEADYQTLFTEDIMHFT